MEKSYQKAIKHMQKITHGKGNNRLTMYKGVYHNENILNATDGHRLLHAELNDGDFTEKILNVKTYEEIEGEFPDAKSIFVTDEDIQIHLDIEKIKGLKSVLTCIKSAKYKQVKLMKKSDYWCVVPHEDSKFNHDENLQISYTLAKDTENENKGRVLNLEYLMQAIDFIKDTKSDAQLIMKDNSMFPIQFNDVGYFSDKDECKIKYKYVICPIRVY
ncbi:hypothetical protein [Staphylococcus equorum]|uniref:hypothetical protein n=1 Tax=Staphylococcus equorum TaxID=246432 RepID=UPI001869036F|nr:hypothetical protein [Staphylococcus equorum]